MELLTINEILNAAKGTLFKGDKNSLVKNITIDSRIVKHGDLFIAIRGKTLDGYKFIEDAIKKGAETIISQQVVTEYPNVNLIQVNNTTTALGDIAQYYRKKFSPTVIAITGSNGKTTTKEMVAEILKRKVKVVKAPNSYNNDIGVPLTILQLIQDTRTLILEMEMNELGGTKRLCDIAQPQVGVITNVGDTHLEFLQSRDGVAKEKSELLEAIALYGTAILNADDPMVMQIGNKFRYKEKVTFGFNKKNNIYADNITNKNELGTEFRLCGKYHVTLNIPGVYNIYNALAAITIARVLDFDFKDIINSLETFRLTTMRMEQLNINGIDIINDAYNANPQSMMASLVTFSGFTCKGRKIAILGDMLELGKKSPELHKNIGRKIPDGINILITVGEQATFIAEEAKKINKLDLILQYPNPQEAANKLIDIIKIGDKILIKGSRAVKMEEIINKFKEYYGIKSKTS